MTDEPLTPIEEALVRALTRAIVRELREDATRIGYVRQIDEAVERRSTQEAERQQTRSRRVAGRKQKRSKQPKE